MGYREFASPPELASHVACVWSHAEAPKRVLPDGCADIVWTGERLIVAGPATRAIVPQVPAGATKLGIRFQVGAAGTALGLPAAELLDRSPDLADVWRHGAELTERVAEAPGTSARLEVLTHALARHLAEAREPDPLVRAAARELSRPGARVEALGARVHLSTRQLRRRFERAVGYSPRTLGRVLRLQRFLGMANGTGDLARVAAEAGYADQPHLTRECVSLAGVPAAALLATGVRPAGERLSSA